MYKINKPGSFSMKQWCLAFGDRLLYIAVWTGGGGGVAEVGGFRGDQLTSYVKPSSNQNDILCAVDDNGKSIILFL